ncbi:MAG: AAA family ATPase [Clostridia bacterium]|nr:AAA family ATPase [Clostridia bacterium]
MERKPIPNRILILGCPGSGKSTLARALAARTGLPLVHLDNLWWRADGTHISREAFDRVLGELLRGEQWIMDGNYSRTIEVRLRAADTVIFLDYPESVCMAGITARVGQPRSDMPWAETSLDPELVALVRNYRRDHRPQVLALLQKYPDKQALIFTSREEAARWLSEI